LTKKDTKIGNISKTKQVSRLVYFFFNFSSPEFLQQIDQ